MAAQKILQEIKSLEQWINLWKELDKKANDVRDIIELAAIEEDESFYNDIRKELDNLNSEIEKAEFKNMLSGSDDDKNCILTIHSGAGGTEAQDWADMLLRMYLRWGEQNGYQMNIVDILDGDGAGIKSAGLISISIVSSISGITNTEAKDVCLLLFESKGEIRTSR